MTQKRVVIANMSVSIHLSEGILYTTQTVHCMEFVTLYILNNYISYEYYEIIKRILVYILA